MATHARAITGRLSFKKLFQMPVKVISSVISEAENPQDRKIAAATPTATAPPPGMMLEIVVVVWLLTAAWRHGGTQVGTMARPTSTRRRERSPDPGGTDPAAGPGDRYGRPRARLTPHPTARPSADPPTESSGRWAPTYSRENGTKIART